MSKVYLPVKNPVLKGGKHYITLDYGRTYKDGSFHKGIDLVASQEAGKGADYIIAFADGKVTSAVNTFSGQTTETTTTASMGNYVIIDHGNGYKTRYMHMLKGSVKVKAGDSVKKGQVIGYMGNTGNSKGRHLHFDISYNKSTYGGYSSNGRYYLDPKPYLKGEKSFSSVSKPVSKPVQPSTNDEYIVKVNTFLNVRKEPSVNSKVLGMLSNGSIVKKIGSKGDWTEISGEKANGWVMTRYLVKR